MMLLYVLEEGIGLCYIEAESSEMKCQSQSGGKFYAEKDATQMVFVIQNLYAMNKPCRNWDESRKDKTLPIQ